MKSVLFILTITGFVAAQSAPPWKGIPEIARTANGAIVSIVMSDKDGSPIAQGSGFVIGSDGVILTNYHVIAQGSSAVVKLPDGVIYPVDGVLATDKTRDVAVIKAHGKHFRTLTLGDSDQLQVGEEVVAIGNPLSLESTVSNGIVSGIRTIEKEGGKFLQITAPISPGSSGGPLFNMAGEVVGITTLYLEGGENLNFAIPINEAKLLLSADTQVQNFPETQVEAPKTVSEILDWIQTNLESETVDKVEVIAGVSYQVTMTNRFELSFEGCRVTVAWHFNEDFHNGIILPDAGNISGPFDLGSLRPEPEQMPISHNGGNTYQLRLYSIKPFVSRTVDRTQPGAHNFFIEVTTQDMAERQRKAWHDAIILCGGKKTKDDLY